MFIAPASRSLSHTLARKRASEAGARGATMPHVTADMLARLMSIDFDRLGSALARARGRCSTRAREAHITCPRGTDLTLDLTGRSGIADDGDLTAPGAFGNLPCGEGFIAPAGGSGHDGRPVDRGDRADATAHPATLTLDGRPPRATRPSPRASGC